MIGIDIETHDWVEDGRTFSEKGDYGKFGHYYMTNDENFEHSRIVQLGWAIWDKSTESMKVKEHLVRPCGFQISGKATDKHHIENKVAERQGLSLVEVLEELNADLLAVQEKKGILVAHQLEFDSTIIEREMARCGIDASCLGTMARNGTCTMSPEIGAWLKECFSEQTKSKTAKHTLSLKDLVLKLTGARVLRLFHRI